MFFLYLALVIAVFVIVIPGCRWLISRLMLWQRIRSLCKKKQYTLHTGKGLWFFGSRYGKKVHFVVETQDALYAVKLFGVPQRLATLMLYPDGKYGLRRIFSMLLQVKIPLDTAPVAFPECDFSALTTDAAKPLHSVLMVHPAPLNISLKNREGENRPFVYGDTFHGMEIITLKDLITILT